MGINLLDPTHVLGATVWGCGFLAACLVLTGFIRRFARRIEAVDRIQQAATGLEERITEIEEGEAELQRLDDHLLQLTEQLMALAEDPAEVEHHDIFAPA